MIDQKARPTIGLLFDNLYENYGVNIWGGVVEYAEEQDLNVICFSGGSLNSPESSYSQRNVIYDMVGINNVDGLVAISSSIGNYINQEELRCFFNRYTPLPLVSIGVPIGGCPCVVVDNEHGMRSQLEHLINIHGCKKIAFIQGPALNPDARTRFQVYKKVLKEYSIPYDPSLVVPGSFDSWIGGHVLSVLLDERGQQVDAIVGANDYVALNIINALQARGIRVPEDIAVVGFDDIKESSGNRPSLTTVHQPLNKMGRYAAQTLLAKMRGEEVPGKLVLPTKLIIRRSCGCFSHTKLHSLVNAISPGDAEILPGSRREREEVISKILNVMRNKSVGYSGEHLLAEWAARLYESYINERKVFAGENFLLTLEDIITRSLKKDFEVNSWYGIVSTMFEFITRTIMNEKEALWTDNLWKESFIFIGETAEGIQTLNLIKADAHALRLNKINQSLITTFDMGRLKSVILKELPKLGINSCYMSFYVGNKNIRKYSKLFFFYNKGTSLKLEKEKQPFLTHQLIPGNIKLTGARKAFLVMPLFFKTDQLGFVLFEIGPMEARVYETLASQLSSAIKGSRLVDNRKRLEKEILEISGREQQRIGQDLHDGLGQILTGVAFLSKVLEDQLRAKNLDEAESMKEISELISQSIAQTRSLARGLFPVELEQNGLISALEELAQKIGDQFKIKCSFICMRDILIEDNTKALHLYRIAQEAVNNALKHGCSDEIVIRIATEKERIMLSITDNGCGFPETLQAKKGMGLRIMRYRANMIGARIEFLSNEKGGSMVKCCFKEKGGIKKEYW